MIKRESGRETTTLLGENCESTVSRANAHVTIFLPIEATVEVAAKLQHLTAVCYDGSQGVTSSHDCS